jgi:predicted lipid-binding transport protein (Tim44 family)
MFTVLTHDLHERGANQKTQTEVLAVDGTLLGVESNADERMASVRFNGTLRVDGEIERVDEVWNFTRPTRGKGGWVLAGIQQLS